MTNDCKVTKDGEHRPLLRRPKERPCDDFWHTLKIGLPVAIILFLLLPHII